MGRREVLSNDLEFIVHRTQVISAERISWVDET